MAMLGTSARTRPKAFRLVAWEATEYEIHVGVVDAMRKFGRPDCVWFHPANGEARSIQAGRRLKAMGTRAGVSDLVFIRNGAVLFLELKRHAGRQSASQVEFQQAAERAGAEYVVAYSLDGALEVLQSRGLLSRKLV